MTSLQKLKDSISEIRKVSSNFAEWDTTSFPEGKLGKNALSAAEACALLEQIVQTIELALDNEQHCIERISPAEMNITAGEISSSVQLLQADAHDDYVKHLGVLIERTRPFAMLSMEKMDSKRYREIVNLEDTLAKIRAREASSLQASHKAKEAEGKISEIDKLAIQNQKIFNECHDVHAQMTTLLGKIQGMSDEATARKAEIDQFSALIQSREESLASQKVATEEYEKKLESFSTEHESLIQKAQGLIDSAEKALQLKAAEGLGAAFKAKEEKSGDRRVKVLWLSLGLYAAIAAIILGWLISSGTSDTGTVLGRSLVMLVAVGVALFAGRQYAKNKAIEEDYAYKAALVASYPGFASKLDNEEMQKKYTSKLLEEILQDPQRVRKAEKKNPLSGNPLSGSDKNESSDG